MSHWPLDLRYAARSLRRRPGFALAAASTLGLGIGLSTALFSLLSALLLRPLPFADAGRLVALTPRLSSGGFASHFSYPQLRRIEEGGGGLAEFAAFAYRDMSFEVGQQPEVVRGGLFSAGYFRVLGVRPQLGRFPVGGTDPVVVLSDRLWRRRFGASPEVIGRPVRVNGVPMTVAAVAAPTFEETRAEPGPDVWAPLSAAPLLLHDASVLSSDDAWLDVAARLRPGITPDAAQLALTALIRQDERERPSPFSIERIVVERVARVPGDRGTRFWQVRGLLAAATLLVLSIGCANFAGMLLAHASERRRELLVRLAVGARRAHLVGQVLGEGLLLALAGGAIGLVVASALVGAIPSVPWPVTVLITARIDAQAVAFAVGAALATALIASLGPALRASDGAAAGAARASLASAGEARVRRWRLVGQIAMSCFLLVGAGLFERALQRASRVDPGFDPRDLYFASFDLSLTGYSEPTGREFYRRVMERARALPGVERASLASAPQFGGATRPLCGTAEDAPNEARDRFSCVEYVAVDEEYFRTMRIPLLAGRGFTPADRAGAPAVAVVNQTMARRFWGGRSPVGKHFGAGAERVVVVGVVADGKYASLHEEPQPFLYRPFAQSYSPAATVHMRIHRGALAALAALRTEVREVDPALPLAATGTLEERLGASMRLQRTAALLLALFGLSGLALAAVGIYGSTAYWVNQRTRETGIQMALGASPHQVVRDILSQGVALALGGAVLGLIVAGGASRLVSALLFGAKPVDPALFAAILLLIVAVGLVASTIPARRAASIAPAAALRNE